jgi:hypothetical protein
MFQDEKIFWDNRALFIAALHFNYITNLRTLFKHINMKDLCFRVNYENNSVAFSPQAKYTERRPPR